MIVNLLDGSPVEIVMSGNGSAPDRQHGQHTNVSTIWFRFPGEPWRPSGADDVADDGCCGSVSEPGSVFGGGEMSTLDELLAGILENPESDAQRLVWSDCAEEDGQSERAEFCRLQCALAKMAVPPRTVLGSIMKLRRNKVNFFLGQNQKAPEIGERIDLILTDSAQDLKVFQEKKHHFGLLVKDVNRSGSWDIDCIIDEQSGPRDGRYEAMHRRERELLSDKSCLDWFTVPELAVSWTTSEGLVGWLSKPSGAGGETIRAECHRGFVGQIAACSAAAWCKHARTILAVHPIEVAIIDGDRLVIERELPFSKTVWTAQLQSSTHEATPFRQASGWFPRNMVWPTRDDMAAEIGEWTAREMRMPRQRRNPKADVAPQRMMR